MNIDRLCGRLYLRRERLDRRRWRWYQRWCWFHHWGHEVGVEIGVTVFFGILTFVVTYWFTGLGEKTTISVLQAISLIVLPMTIMSLIHCSKLGMMLFDQFDQLTESIHNYYERRLEVVSERLTKVETMLINHQVLLEEWAGVPDGAIMPVRMEAELADRGLSLAEQLQLP